MICSSCSHSVVQKAFDRDRVLREVLYCDLLTKEVVMLVDCSRYQDMKKEVKVEYVSGVADVRELLPVDLREKLPKKKGWPKGKKRVKKDGLD